MNLETWNTIDGFFTDAPTMKSVPVPYAVIDKESDSFGVELDSNYREFIHRYGAGILGAFTIYGIGLCSMMGKNEDSVFKVTNKFRAECWPNIENWLIISLDHSGNPVGINSVGEIWISDVVHGCVDKLSDDFEGYVLDWCLDFDD